MIVYRGGVETTICDRCFRPATDAHELTTKWLQVPGFSEATARSKPQRGEPQDVVQPAQPGVICPECQKGKTP